MCPAKTPSAPRVTHNAPVRRKPNDRHTFRMGEEPSALPYFHHLIPNRPQHLPNRREIDPLKLIRPPQQLPQ